MNRKKKADNKRTLSEKSGAKIKVTLRQFDLLI